MSTLFFRVVGIRSEIIKHIMICPIMHSSKPCIYHSALALIYESNNSYVSPNKIF